MTIEKKIEKKLQKRMKDLGGLSYKWVSPGCAGVPDRIVIYEGFICFVEIKSPSGRLSGRQMAVHQGLRNAGAAVYNLDSEEDLEIFIKLLRNAAL